MNYKGKHEVEAYRLTIANMEEMSAWTNWAIYSCIEIKESIHLFNGEKKCNLGDWIVQQKYTGNKEFTVYRNSHFIQNFTLIYT